MKIIKKEDFVTTNWSGGTTSELIIKPKSSVVSERNFDLRVSSATCDLDSSVFTPYNGYMRYITPLDGELKLKNGNKDILLKPYEIYYFSGSDDVVGLSKVRDFNLILKDGMDNSMYTLDINEDLLFNAEKEVLIFNYESNAFVDGKEFDKFSAIVLEKGEEIKLSFDKPLLVCEI